MQDKYDYLIIGSGPAGYVSAIKAAQLGLKIGVVEKDMNMLGGVCLNEGCIPAKSLYHSAEVFDTVRRSPELCGLAVRCDGVDMGRFVEKSRKASEQLRKGLFLLLKRNGVDLIEGSARFVDSHTVSLSGRAGGNSVVRAEKFLIATGSVARPLPRLPFDGRYVISSSHGIRLRKTPANMLIVGGGAIGTEFASFFSIIGTDVTVVEAEGSLLPAEDWEISRRLQSIFKKKGIRVFTSSRIKDVTIADKDVTVTIEDKEKESTGKYEVVLVAVGRVPATSDIGLERVGLETDREGFIPVDGEMRSDVGNIYAAGDVLRTPMLAHLAYAEGEAAAEAAAGRKPQIIDYSCVPNAVYTEVQVASVGITEEDARSQDIDFTVGKHFFKANGRAVVNLQTEGFIKIIAERNTRKLLGVHIIGHGATELIHEFVVAKRAGLSAEDVGRTIHAHPTFSEAAVDACKSVFDKPIHG